MAQKPRITIGIPCYGQVSPEYLEDFARFMYHCGRRMPEYDFFLAIKKKSEQFRARNAIVEAAIQVNSDWLLMLDDDMIINHMVTSGPSEVYSFLNRMIGHNKDICGALYYQREGHCAPVIMAKANERGYRLLRDEEIERRLQKVDVAGGGCLLIKMRVFDRIKQPYFQPEYEFGTDIQLCRKAAECGMEVWADTSIELGHLRQERVIVSSQNRRQFMSDMLPGEVRQELLADEIFDRLIRDGIEYTGYSDIDAMIRDAEAFHHEWKRRPEGQSDADWYRLFPNQRIARQIAFNSTVAHKRGMTEFILGSVNRGVVLDVLDFGCGIGIPAFTLAERGHRVTACDILGTGTFDFLQWRATKHKLSMFFHELPTGGLPHFGGTKFDLIIAMDVLEHIRDWKPVLRVLASSLYPGGFFFCNNGILDDPNHAEHYPLGNKEFIAECVANDLMPLNQITFQKRAAAPEKVAV